MKELFPGPQNKFLPLHFNFTIPLMGKKEHLGLWRW